MKKRVEYSSSELEMESSIYLVKEYMDEDIV